MNEKSLLDLAFEAISKSKDSLPFKTLWKEVCKAKELTEEEAAQRVSQFYTNLLFDGRFVTLGDNIWDLRSRHTFDKVHIDMKDVYSEIDTDDGDSEDDEEEKEYNEVFEEKNFSRDDEIERETNDDDDPPKD